MIWYLEARRLVVGLLFLGLARCSPPMPVPPANEGLGPQARPPCDGRAAGGDPQASQPDGAPAPGDQSPTCQPGDGQPVGDPGLPGDELTPGDPLPSACQTLTCVNGRCVTDGVTEFCLCNAGFLGSADGRTCSAAAGTVCEGVSCSAEGNCILHYWGFGIAAECACRPGYIPYGLTCIPENAIYCRDAAGALVPHGTRRCDATDAFLEVCHDGDGDGDVEWIFGAACASGGSCASGCLNQGCPDQPCPVGTACVTEAHGQPLGVCVATCDCSNCSNCGPDNSDGRWNDWQEYCGAAPNQSPATSACSLRCPSAGDGCIPYDPPICWPMEGCFSG